MSNTPIYDELKKSWKWTAPPAPPAAKVPTAALTSQQLNEYYEGQAEMDDKPVVTKTTKPRGKKK